VKEIVNNNDAELVKFSYSSAGTRPDTAVGVVYRNLENPIDNE